MPTSDPELISETVLQIIRWNPKSVLDVGCGWGKFGFLCREYLDVMNGRYDKKDWKVRIDAVEVFEPYLTPIHSFIYDSVKVEDVKHHVDGMENYDLVLLMDVLEHLQKEEAFAIIEKVRVKAKHVLISTPIGYTKQGAVHGNEAESHKCGFTPEDFKRYNAVSLPFNRTFLVMIDGLA